MTTIFHPDHPHFQVHKAFLEGSFANPENPPVVEVENIGNWYVCTEPIWHENCHYRLKRMRTRTISHPEPLREAPSMHTKYWAVSPFHSKPFCMTWEGCSTDLRLLKNGVVFATEADAQQCYDAYFGEQK